MGQVPNWTSAPKAIHDQLLAKALLLLVEEIVHECLEQQLLHVRSRRRLLGRRDRQRTVVQRIRVGELLFILGCRQPILYGDRAGINFIFGTAEE
jgi:hypothetical protein